FKRLLGTASRLRFASAGQELTPEQASTEVLKALLGYALVESGTSIITGAVVTIPAAFNQMQSEATLSAAHAAGLDRMALLQEPVAAAMAAMANSRNRSGLFLVYDLGGGTFDLALVQALDGSVTVLAHEGLNMLGGSNFDRIIVDNVVRPWLHDSFELPENFSADTRFGRLLRVAKRAAELAKIDLSTREMATINAADEIVRLEDQRGEPIYIDVALDRHRLDALVADSVGETIALCRKLIDDNGYRHDDIDRIVLIGGPTKMPTIRQRVQDELGIAVEDIVRVDPMTSVAVGAAIYCEGRDWRKGESSAKASRAAVETEGSVVVTYEYEARTASRRARLTIRGSGGSEKATIQVDSEAGWTSGRRSLAEPVVLDLELADPGPNRFQALVFDARGRPVAEASKTLVVERLVATTTGIPATQTIAVRVRDGSDHDTLDTLLRKGAILPANGIHVCRVAETRRAADPEPFRVDIFQLADEQVANPEHNLCVGQFE
ncbi:MAG: Hsp70 family protein, partial [Bradyrhizobium sp.]